MTNENVAVAQRWFEEVWNQRRLETIDELLTPESVCRGEASPFTGPEEFRTQLFMPMVEGFPDLRVTVEQTMADGNQVVVRWTANATHTGSAFGASPTGKAVAFRGITWMRIDGGKLVDGWQQSNISETIRSLSEP